LRDPCADLRDQIFRDVNGARLALFLVSDVLGVVERAAVVTTAFRAAAAMGIKAERGTEERTGSRHFAKAAIEHAPNESGMIGDAHSGDLEGLK
jgi:hypothetical protein